MLGKIGNLVGKAVGKANVSQNMRRVLQHPDSSGIKSAVLPGPVSSVEERIKNVASEMMLGKKITGTTRKSYNYLPDLSGINQTAVFEPVRSLGGENFVEKAVREALSEILNPMPNVPTTKKYCRGLVSRDGHFPNRQKRNYSMDSASKSVISDALQNVKISLVAHAPGPTMKHLCGLFEDRIVNSPFGDALGGEKFLTVEHPDPNPDSGQKHSIHLMHFSGEQHKHKHNGPRVLVLFGAEEWSLFLGPRFKDENMSYKNNEEKTEGRLNVVEVKFPGNTIFTISLQPNTIHGFKGGDLAAISFHYTDLEELKELQKLENKEGSAIDMKDPNMMGKLTTVPNPDTVNCIATVSYLDVDRLLKGFKGSSR